MGCGQKMVPLANEILPDILQKSSKGPFLRDNQQLKDHKFSFQIPSHYQHNTSNGYFGKKTITWITLTQSLLHSL